MNQTDAAGQDLIAKGNLIDKDMQQYLEQQDDNMPLKDMDNQLKEMD